MSLTQALHRTLQQRPDAIATIFRDRRQNYRSFGDRVARLAGALQGLGMGVGEPVALLSLNSDRYLEYFMAVPWGGGVINPVNTRWSASEVAFSLDDCSTAILLVDDQFTGMVPELRQRAKSLRTVIYTGEQETPEGMLSYEDLIASGKPVPDARRHGNDLAGIFYTGGTTGFPKGVMLSHNNLISVALALVASGIAKPGCIGLHAAPMFHLADFALLNAMLTHGSTHVILPGFEPLTVLKTLQDERISEVILVPTMIQMLVDHPQAGDFDLSHLQMLLYGASPISEALLKRAMALLPNAGLLQAYGMTELAPLATLLLPQEHHIESKMRSAGRAGLCADVRIVDENDQELPRGQVGEVVVRGPHVMLGYWNRPEATAEALKNGWMHTGDGAYMDDEGYVFVVDRIKDMIVTGGENVYSAEVENAIAQHSAVANCAVIGVPSEAWGETVHAVVVLKASAALTIEELSAHCAERIAKYKCPRSLSFIEALPLSGAGKVLKRDLRKPFWDDQQRGVG